jgi:hypothetical protein
MFIDDQMRLQLAATRGTAAILIKHQLRKLDPR